MSSENCLCMDCNIDTPHTHLAYNCSKCSLQLDERHTYHIDDLVYCQDCVEDILNGLDEE